MIGLSLKKSYVYFGVSNKDPFLIFGEEWHEGVVSHRHPFFDALCARQKLVRFIGIGVPRRPRPELPVGAPHLSIVISDGS